VVLLTSTLPLFAAILLARSLFSQASSVWFRPEVGEQLDRGVAVHKDYVAAVKDDMRHVADALAADEVLRARVRMGASGAAAARLGELFARDARLVSLIVTDGASREVARRDRGRPVDDATEKSLVVQRPLAEDDGAATLVATFAIDRKPLDALESAGEIVARYHRMERGREELQSAYLRSFAILLAITIVVTAGLGTMLARSVTRRIRALADATERAARGDLEARVPVTDTDELGELAAAFNHMLGEIQQSRSRIELLQRLSAWQEIARRLAHEIKNPLTPIQLAVEECHRKYTGDDAKYRALLDTTLEIVKEEIGTLRRLVGEFSRFARLPHVHLEEADVGEFLRECEGGLAHLAHLPACIGDDADGAAAPVEPGEPPLVRLSWRIPDARLPAALDRQMLRRVIVNLARNAVQAVRDARLAEGRPPPLGVVEIGAEHDGDGVAIHVEDDGPGVGEEAAARVFDPYFTTKEGGTGLGLAVVQKIVLEHGGTVEVGRSARLGGARFTVRLPPPYALLETAPPASGRAPIGAVRAGA
jgi:nitrogen fixation/metabolism regulation signal transduction histidine kinase